MTGRKIYKRPKIQFSQYEVIHYWLIRRKDRNRDGMLERLPLCGMTGRNIQ